MAVGKGLLRFFDPKGDGKDLKRAVRELVNYNIPREQAEQIIIGNIPTDMVGFTPERVSREIQNLSRINDQGVREASGGIAWVNPQDFVNSNAIDPSRIKDQTGMLDYGLLASNEQTPFITSTDGNVFLHEGRHRMQALANEGVTSAPILVKNLENKYPYKEGLFDTANPNRHPMNLSLGGPEARNVGGSGSDRLPDLNLQNYIEATPENEQKINSLMQGLLYSNAGKSNVATAAAEDASRNLSSMAAKPMSDIVDMSTMPFDPRFTGSVAGGDPRVFQAEAANRMNFAVEPRGILDRNEISIADLEGRPFVTSMSDRTAAGGWLTDINGVPLDRPVDLRGGQDYMRDNPGNVWASARGPVEDIFALTARMRKEFGADPVFLPWRMAPTGNDFSNMGVDAMVTYAESALDRSALKDLDKIIKTNDTKRLSKKVDGKKVYYDVPLGLPDWPGFGSKKMGEYMQNLSGDQRKLLADVLDKNGFGARGKGPGLSVAEARLATSDPRQYDATQGGIQNVGVLDLSKNPAYDPSHPAYPFSLKGDYAGTIKEDVPIWGLLDPRGVYKQTKSGGLEAYDRPELAGRTATPGSEDLRSLQMGARGGIIDDKALRFLQDQGIINSIPTGGLISQIANLESFQDTVKDPAKTAASKRFTEMGLNPDTDYNYGTLLPIKRAISSKDRESDLLGGYRPAVPGLLRDLMYQYLLAEEANRYKQDESSVDAARNMFL